MQPIFSSPSSLVPLKDLLISCGGELGSMGSERRKMQIEGNLAEC